MVYGDIELRQSPSSSLNPILSLILTPSEERRKDGDGQRKSGVGRNVGKELHAFEKRAMKAY